MRVLITGATGGLGRNALEHALALGWTATASGRNPAILKELAPVDTACVDLSTQTLEAACRLVAGHDAVWHCAALSSPWGAYADFLAANVTASTTLFEAAGRCEVPVFVHISTPALYFDFTHRYGVREAQVAAAPVNHYAATKLLAESALQAMARKYPRTRLVILRPRAIFGPYDQVLFPRLLALAKAGGGTLTLPRGGATCLDLTYVENVVHAMHLATTTPVPSSLVLNVTNGAPCTVRQALSDLMTELGQPLRIKALPYAVLAPIARLMEGASHLTGKEPRLTRYSLGALAFDMTLDISAAQATLGYQPLVSLPDAIARTAAWLRRAHG